MLICACLRNLGNNLLLFLLEPNNLLKCFHKIFDFLKMATNAMKLPVL